MKPLPLLLTLVALALVGSFTLMSRKTETDDPRENVLSPIPPAPLPLDHEEPPLPLPSPPLLEGDHTPAPELISFVEEFFQLKFDSPPVFSPVPAETIITTVETGISAAFQNKQLKELNTICQKLGLLPEFQVLEENLIIMLAGEMRGLVTPQLNYIMNDFVPSSPPEQAALVNLLSQRLVLQKLPFPRGTDSPDMILARHYAIQTLALAAESKFRQTLPSYPPSLSENLRQSILLGLPAFFHELSTFSEFHLVSKMASTTPNEALERFTKLAPPPSRSLLTFPFNQEPSELPTEFGAIPLYVILLQSTDPTTARTLATTLLSDHVSMEEEDFQWTLQFSSTQSVPRTAELFRSYYSLRDVKRRVKIEVNDATLVISVKGGELSPATEFDPVHSGIPLN